MRNAKLYLALALTAILVGCGGDSPQDVADPFPERTELSISDSIGIEMGDSVYVFGSIIDVCHGPAGEILVLDQINCCIRVYDENGDYVTQIGRSGEGPGEFFLPFAITTLADGRIFVNDPMQNSFVTFDSGYTYLENITDWTNGPPMDPSGLDGSSYSGMRLGFNPTDAGFEIIRLLGKFSDSTEPDITYLEDPVELDPTDFTLMINAMLYAFIHTGDHQGRFFYSPVSSELYEVVAFDAQGNETFRIVQEIPGAEKTPLEIEDEKAYMESWMARMGAQGVVIEWEPDPWRQMVRSLGVDSQDRLWVHRGTELAPLFDIYDMNGQHLLTAQLPRESASWKFHIDTYGILAWEEDPEAGFQKLYLIEVP